MALIDALLRGDKAAAEADLRRLGARRWNAAFENLVRFREAMTPTEFGRLLEILEATLGKVVDPDRALNNLERYHQVSSGALRPLALALERPFVFELVVEAFGYSQFFADVLIRYPHYVAWIGEPEALTAPLGPEASLRGLRAALESLDSAEARHRASVRWLRRQLLRAGLRVMRGLTDEVAFMAEISDAAGAILQIAFEEAARTIGARFGRPLEEDEDGALSDREAGLAIVAMGKLGGRELNFSSDIDLVFVYSAEGRTTGVQPEAHVPTRGVVSNHVYFTRLAQAIAEFLTAATAEGYLFRVDLRLRPDGDEGPIVRSMDAFEIYYETQARPWERLALIKAFALAGDPVLCERFNRLSRALAFALGAGAGVRREVADLRRRIDAAAASGSGGTREIKRGPGGLREIEFLTQTLQLLHGPHAPALQARSTLEALEALAAAGRLPPDEAAALGRDYLFLRTVEHRLQIMDLRQTHTLPSAPDELDRLARRCGFVPARDASAGEQLFRRWTEISTRVHRRFSDFFEEGESPERSAETPAQTAARRLLQGDPEKDLLPLLAPFGLASAGAVRTLRRLGGRGRNVYLPANGREAFAAVLPGLIQALGRSCRPLAALAHLDSFLSASASMTALYAIFHDRPRLMELLIEAFGRGDFFGRTLSGRPEYLDSLLQSGDLTEPTDTPTLRERLVHALGPFEGQDSALLAERLARLRRFEFTMTGLAEIAERIGFEEAQRRMTLVADAIVEAAATWASASASMGSAADRPPGAGWAVIGLGKLGGRELNIFSDLDLIFCWDDESPTGGIGEAEAGRRAAAVVELLTRSTPEGSVFSVDARLRPEGRNAPLAPSLGRYLQYFAERAEPWEFQAMMKFRFIAGDAPLAERLIARLAAIIIRRLEAPSAMAELRTAIVETRRRIERSVRTPRWVLSDFKKGPGGLIDLEFLAQFFQLTRLKNHPRWVGRTAGEVFTLMAEAGELDAAEAATLRQDYDFLRGLEARARLLFETERSYLPGEGEKWESLRRAAVGLLPPGAGDLQEHVLRTLRRNRSRFERILRHGG